MRLVHNRIERLSSRISEGPNLRLEHHHQQQTTEHTVEPELELEPEPEPEQDPEYEYAHGPEHEQAEVECCVCFGDYPSRATLLCAIGHSLCPTCAVSYAEVEMTPEELGKNFGLLKCPVPDCEAGPWLEHELNDAANRFGGPALTDAFARGQRQLLEKLVVASAIVCPACDYMVLIDTDEARQALKDVNKIVKCDQCGKHTCYHCEPPMVLERPHAEDHEHRGIGLGADMKSIATEGDGQRVQSDELSDAQQTAIRNRMFELLTQGAVSYCPQGCPNGIVKSAGCNCMCCAEPNCRRYFCYLCNADLGTTSREAHNGGHFRAGGCWMFDGGDLLPEVVQGLRTKALLTTHLQMLPDTHRRWLLQDDVALREMREIGFEYSDADALAVATPGGQPETVVYGAARAVQAARVGAHDREFGAQVVAEREAAHARHRRGQRQENGDCGECCCTCCCCCVVLFVLPYMNAGRAGRTSSGAQPIFPKSKPNPSAAASVVPIMAVGAVVVLATMGLACGAVMATVRAGRRLAASIRADAIRGPVNSAGVHAYAKTTRRY